ncbi:MAG TPA: DUF503 domain-containing protein [Candidatus Sumerlaeota bacterium]|nr:DUF503 domain-containing protein [Candidatus Sumerlaeota bacterium]
MNQGIMLIGLLRLDLLLPGCNSLKDKRSVIKRILFYIRKNYNVAAAETGSQDLWRRAELSFVTVSSLRDAAENTLRHVLSEMDSQDDIEVLSDKIEFL